MKRILLVAAKGDAAALRRLRSLAEGLALEGYHPLQGLLPLGAGDPGLDWLHAEAASPDCQGLAVLGETASGVGRWLAWSEPGSSSDRLPRVLVVFPPFGDLSSAASFYPGALALGADKKTAVRGKLPARPWTLRKSTDPAPDRRLLPRAAEQARGKACRALLRLLSAARKSAWRPPAAPRPAPVKAGEGAQEAPGLDLVAAGPRRLVALFARDRFPQDSVVILKISGDGEQRRRMTTGSSVWFEVEPGWEVLCEIRGPDGFLLARAGPMRIFGSREAVPGAAAAGSKPPKPPPESSTSSW